MHDVSLRQASWHGIDGWLLESEAAATFVVPWLGAKLLSLLDKRSGVEWLAGSGSRPVRPVAYGAGFTEQDMSGWDEMFPTISACPYPGPGDQHGAPLPDHGEVWSLPWTVESTQAGRLRLSVQGRALPYRLTRTAYYAAPDCLALQYDLVNLGRDPLPYIWAAHPQFDCGEHAQIVLPPQIKRVCNVLPEAWGWGAPETGYAWPQAPAVNGQVAELDRVGPPALRRARKFYVLPGERAGSIALVRRPGGEGLRPDGVWLRMAWDTAGIPYLGLWVDEGALHHQSVAAPEPATGFYDNLDLAWQNQQVMVLEPGAGTSWTLTVQLGAGRLPPSA